MRRFFLFLSVFIGGMAFAQSSAGFTLSLDEISIPNAPEVQSFAIGQAGGKWLVIGGRRDGLHQRQPFAAFLAAANNMDVYVIDPISKQVWNQSLSSLSTAMQEQLQSTNPNFYQRGNTLYIIGGYGYSNTQQDHYTYPNLTAVDVPGAIAAIVAGTSMAPHFSQMTDNRLQITGGQMSMLNDTFYIVGGQNFIGRYNPMGPTHGPGFFQAYTNEIRMFKINGSGSTLSISDYNAIRDTTNFHRRDYNMMPQIFPDGSRGFTVFSGPFQYTADLPFLNCLDIKNGTYQEIPNFEQRLSNYHSAKMGVWESGQDKIHNIFFGGIAQYYLDQQGLLIEDQDVPFVKTISRITRFSNDSLVEYATGLEMPDYLGAGAEFIPLKTAPFAFDDVLDLDALPAGRQLVGHIFGGIESTQANIFFINTGAQSHASRRVFEVYIEKTATKMDQGSVEENIRLEIYPNPAAGKVMVEVWANETGNVQLIVTDIHGKNLFEKQHQLLRKQSNKLELDMDSLAAGVYFVTLKGEKFQTTKKLELSR